MLASTLILNPERGVKLLNAEIEKLPIEGSPAELYDPIRYIMALGGKRMRPLLVLLAHQFYSDEPESAIAPAIGVELFHNFTLVHDDIMDNAPLRRGNQTVHEKWNVNTAILSGDVMMVKAYEQFLGVDKEILSEVLKRFNTTACQVCEGQQLDMLFESRAQVSIPEYLDMIRLKTAVLLGFSLELGGRIANASEEQVNLLYDFGVSMGIGFQLMDDLLDVYGDKEKFGKTVGGDIVANKKTFLLISAIEKSTGKDQEELIKWLNANEFDATKKVEAVRALYDRLGIKQETEAQIEAYYQKAQKLFEKIEAPMMKKKMIKDLMSGLMQRQS
jgi:geranylgeranyl diphosphate synthase type II